MTVDWIQLDGPASYEYIIKARQVDSYGGSIFECSAIDTNNCVVDFFPKNASFDITITACATIEPKLCSLESKPIHSRMKQAGQLAS